MSGSPELSAHFTKMVEEQTVRIFDYRAHRLRWLVSLPFRAILTLSFYGALIAAIEIALSTSYGTLVKIVIAYFVFELIAILLSLIFGFLIRSVNFILFQFINVVPIIGANDEEAQFVVANGPRYFYLEKKLRNEIENWTPADTNELA